MSAINVNTATKEQLKTLKNIGQARATAIIEARDKAGVLTLEDLKLLEGIPNTIWDPLVQSGELVFGPVAAAGAGISKNTDLEEQIKSMKEMIIQKTEMTKSIQKQYEDKLGEQEKLFREQFAQMEAELSGKIQQISDSYTQLEATLRSEIDQRDKKIKQMESIKATTEKIEKLTSSGIYSKPISTSSLVDVKQEDSWKTVTPTSSETSGHKPDFKVSVSEQRGRKVIHKEKEDVRSETLPPLKMSTFDGKTDWRPFFTQFTRLADRYNLTSVQRLDRLLECLRDRALKFYSVKSKTVQDNYELLCQKMNARFGRRDMPHILRRQLQDMKQDKEESLEEFAERTQEIASDGYPDTPEEFIELLAIDAFLKGCVDSHAALTAMNRNPSNLDEAVQYVKLAATNQKVIMGSRRIDLKRVTFDNIYDDCDGEDQGQHELNVRTVKFHDRENSPVPRLQKLEDRLRRTEEGLEETKGMVQDILKIVKENRSRSPIRRQGSGSSNGECFRCGQLGHFARECPRSVNSRSPSPRKDLNFNGLKK